MILKNWEQEETTATAPIEGDPDQLRLFDPNEDEMQPKLFDLEGSPAAELKAFAVGYMPDDLIDELLGARRSGAGFDAEDEDEDDE
jgi:hypothetical protein